MRILIYGAGALGQALGCLLAADGHRIDLLLRPRFVRDIKQQGLRVTGLFGDFSVPPGRIGLAVHPDECRQHRYDYILLTTKSHDTAEAAARIATFPDFGHVVSLQNGCGNLERLTTRFGNERCLAGRVITGFEITAPATVTITVHADAVHIGGSVPGKTPEAASRLASCLSRAGLPTMAVEDVISDLFAKLLYNCALNPLGAILGVPYGALGEKRSSRRIMDRVMDETFAVIRALGGRLEWPDADAYRRHFYQTLLPATAGHRPSMLQDLENGKPTEVEALVGYVAARGAELGLETPASDLLADQIRFLQANNTPYRNQDHGPA